MKGRGGILQAPPLRDKNANGGSASTRAQGPGQEYASWEFCGLRGGLPFQFDFFIDQKGRCQPVCDQLPPLQTQTKSQTQSQTQTQIQKRSLGAPNYANYSANALDDLDSSFLDLQLSGPLYEGWAAGKGYRIISLVDGTEVNITTIPLSLSSSLFFSFSISFSFSLFLVRHPFCEENLCKRGYAKSDQHP